MDPYPKTVDPYASIKKRSQCLNQLKNYLLIFPSKVFEFWTGSAAWQKRDNDKKSKMPWMNIVASVCFVHAKC